MTTRIQLRRDTAVRWASVNPVLAAGEPAVESDTGKLKVGDGTTAWSSLPYILDVTDLTPVIQAMVSASIPIPVTDEYIRDLVGATIVGDGDYIVVDADDVSNTVRLTPGAAITEGLADLEAGLADTNTALGTKVNSSTYTSGLAAKQDVSTLGAAVAADSTVRAAATAMAQHARPAVVIADPGRLSWKPPTLINPTIVDVPSGFYAGTFGAKEDVILELPASSRISTISVTGGRNIIVIGGTTLLNSGTSGSAIMRFLGVSGHVFIEGVSIDANIAAGSPNRHDGIAAYGDAVAPFTNAPDVTIQNCRVVGINGTSATSHSDIYQPQGAIGRLRIDKLTGRSSYQGLFLAPQMPISSRDLRRIDLGYEAGGDPVTYLLWLQDSNATQAGVRTLLSEVFVAPRSGQSLTAQAVFPSTGEVDTSSNAIGALSFDGDASAYWPDKVAATGSVKSGAPASGDFVPAGTVGFGYASPGYLDEVPFTYRSAVLADAPALYLPLDGSSADASGNGLNGTDTAITYTALGGGARQKGAGFVTATSSKISVPDAASLRLSSGSFSIEFWTLITANVTGFPGVIKKGATDAATTGWQVYLASGSPGTPVFKRNNLSAQPPTNSMVLNKWQHWVFRFNAASNLWVWYLNGAKVASGTQAGFNLANADTTALELGHGDSAFLTGTLDEVAVYNSVLTTDRIQAHARGL